MSPKNRKLTSSTKELTEAESTMPAVGLSDPSGKRRIGQQNAHYCPDIGRNPQNTVANWLLRLFKITYQINYFIIILTYISELTTENSMAIK
jgi:hypothetical protein